jgi:HEPN domain-containing protein
MCDIRYFRAAYHRYTAAKCNMRDYKTDEAFLNDAAYNLHQCVEMTLTAFLECVGVTVPETHQIRKLVNMSKDNGSPVIITDWIRDHAGEITEWEAETRYNFDYYLELQFVQEGLQEVKKFLDINGLREERLEEITEEVEQKLKEKLPKRIEIKDDFELNCYYRVFKKKLGKI